MDDWEREREKKEQNGGRGHTWHRGTAHEILWRLQIDGIEAGFMKVVAKCLKSDSLISQKQLSNFQMAFRTFLPFFLPSFLPPRQPRLFHAFFLIFLLFPFLFFFIVQWFNTSRKTKIFTQKRFLSTGKHCVAFFQHAVRSSLVSTKQPKTA